MWGQCPKNWENKEKVRCGGNTRRRVQGWWPDLCPRAHRMQGHSGSPAGAPLWHGGSRQSASVLAGVAVCAPSEQTAGRPSAGQWLWILTEASSQGRTPAVKEGKSYLLVERVILARDFDFRDITWSSQTFHEVNINSVLQVKWG